MAKANPHINVSDIDFKDTWNQLTHDSYVTGKPLIKDILALLDHGANMDLSGKHNITPLYIATTLNCSETVKRLLKQGARVYPEVTKRLNFSQMCRVNPLFYAVKHGYREIVSLLLNNSDNPSKKFSVRLFDIAISKGFLDIAEDLLNHGASINLYAPDLRYSSNLHINAARGNEEIVKLLVSKGARINALDEHNYTALHYATQIHHEGIIEVLLDHGATFDPKSCNFMTPLYHFAAKGKSSILQHFLKSSPEVSRIRDEKNRTLLHIAAKKDQFTVVSLLLDYGADVNAKDKDGLPPVYYTFIKDSPTPSAQDNFTLLLSTGADITALGNRETLLLKAAWKCCNKIVMSLLENNFIANAKDNNGMTTCSATVKINVAKIAAFLGDYRDLFHDICYTGRTALHYSCMIDNLEFFELLIGHGFDINACDNFGVTPIYNAIQRRHYIMVKILLKHGAELNVKSKEFKNALDNAIKNDHVETIKAILQSCPELISLLSNNCCTFLHTAIYNYRNTIMKLFLDYKANVNALNDNGQTALHFVRTFQDARILLEYGADVDVKDNDGETALHKIALIWSSDDVVQLLLQHGADINITNNDGHTALRCAIYKYPWPLINENIVHDDQRDDEIASPFPISLIIHHILKMKALNLYVSDQNLRLVASFNFFRFCESCEVEVAKMKEESIGASDVSFYTFLTSKKRTALTRPTSQRNRCIVESLRSRDYNHKFPIYSSMIDYAFRRAQRRQSLLFRCSNYCNVLLRHELPDEITEKIFTYLCNYDLKKLSDVAYDICCKNVNGFRRRKSVTESVNNTKIRRLEA